MGRSARSLAGVWLLLLLLPALVRAQALPTSYAIIASRAPRHEDRTAQFPEVKDPILCEPGTDLVLLHRDGTEEVLVPGGEGCILDPKLSFDGQTVYYAHLYNARQVTPIYGRDVPVQGSDLFKLHLQTREIVQLTHRAWTPNPSTGRWSSDPTQPVPPGTNYIGHHPFALGPQPLPGGTVLYTTSRQSLLPNKEFTYPLLQLAVLDEATGIDEIIGHLNLGSALHPTVLRDGRIMFSSYEAQGLRDRNQWGLWVIHPDGTNWGPLMSAFLPQTALHFQTQTRDGRIYVVAYYNQNNAGFGTLLSFRPCLPGGPCTTDAVPHFGNPDPNHPSNPWVQKGYGSDGRPDHFRMSFSPREFACTTCFAHYHDRASVQIEGQWAGKITHPQAAPGVTADTNDLLAIWSDGPVNNRQDRGGPLPYPHGEIVLIPGAYPVAWPDALVRVKRSPTHSYMQPIPVVPYRAIYGQDEPDTMPVLQNNGRRHAALPAGTPYALVGTSSFYNRNTAPGVYARGTNPGSNWLIQGADAGLYHQETGVQTYSNADIHAVRLILFEPFTNRRRGPDGNVRSRFFAVAGNERLAAWPAIPLKKPDGQGGWLTDEYGNLDTSFLAKIPADVPFTFQTLDVAGRVLNMSQTWHQLRPGEVRTDCGGCHAHANVAMAFDKTWASKRPPTDLTGVVPRRVEWRRDIQPLLQATMPAYAGKTREALLDEGLLLPFRSRLSPLVEDARAVLTPEDWQALVLWCDLGAPVSLHERYGVGQQENRPTLTLHVQRGRRPQLIVGAASVYGTLDPTTLTVTLNGTDLSARLRARGGGRWALPLPATGQGEFRARVQDMNGAEATKRLVAQW